MEQHPLPRFATDYGPRTTDSAAAAGVALITGAGSGLGRALAAAVAADGWAVGAVDLSAEPLEKLAGELTGRPVAWAVADVTDRSALRAAVGTIEARLGPTELLVANAGIGTETSALDFRAADVEAMIRVNLIGVANSIDAVLAGMLQRRRGHLVGISSLASFRGLPRMAGYCASKAGLNALLEGLRVELRPQGIAVTTVCPGWIRTPLTANLEGPLPYLMEPDAAARHILRAVRERRPVYAFPPPAAWRVRLLRWLPAAASDWMVARLLRSLATE